MRFAITVPEIGMPKKDPEHPCPCQNRPVHLEYKTCAMMWTVEDQAQVEKDQVICEGEVEKKALEFLAPCSGILVEKCIQDDDEFTAGDILGYIEDGR